jgi:hypothetical protein
VFHDGLRPDDDRSQRIPQRNILSRHRQKRMNEFWPVTSVEGRKEITNLSELAIPFGCCDFLLLQLLLSH